MHAMPWVRVRKGGGQLGTKVGGRVNTHVLCFPNSSVVFGFQYELVV